MIIFYACQNFLHGTIFQVSPDFILIMLKYYGI